MPDAEVGTPASDESDQAADPQPAHEVRSDEPSGAGRRVGVLMVVAGSLGLVAAMVLTIDRFRLLQNPDTQLACNLSPFIACGPVMQSRAGALLGFPNPLLGILGFTVVLTTGMLRAAGVTLPRWYHHGMQVGVVAAGVFITWLQTQSLYVIGALCLWCMLVWAVTTPLVVVLTLENAATGRLGTAPQPAGSRLRPYAVTVVAVWYLVVIGAIGLRFYREFALYWFGVAL